MALTACGAPLYVHSKSWTHGGHDFRRAMVSFIINTALRNAIYQSMRYGTPFAPLRIDPHKRYTRKRTIGVSVRLSRV